MVVFLMLRRPPRCTRADTHCAYTTRFRSNEQFRLDGKVAVVAGAGGRGNSIGRAYAIGLANAGASVVVADLNREGAERVAGEIEEEIGRASWRERVCPDV